MTPTLPSIPKLPLLGNMLQFRTNRLGLLTQLSDTCGDIGMFAFGPDQVIMLNNAADAYALLTRFATATRQPNRVRQALRPLIGQGLLLASGEAHMTRRTRLVPWFKASALQSFLPEMIDLTMQHITTWSDGTVIDLVTTLQQLTLQLTTIYLFGHNPDPLATRLDIAFQQVLHSMDRAWSSLIMLPHAWPTPNNTAYRRALRDLDTVIDDMVAAHQHTPSTDSVLTRLYADGYPTDLIYDELRSLLFASYETTVTALVWAWQCLLTHPSQYQRLRHAVAGLDPTTAAETLTQCTLPLHMFKEALRLHPPTYLLTRKTTTAVTLPSGYTIPPDTSVVISPYTLQRRAIYFPAPAQFCPDRFTPEQEARIPRGAYLPFGAGPHACLGSQLALRQGQIVLALMARYVHCKPLPVPPRAQTRLTYRLTRLPVRVSRV